MIKITSNLDSRKFMRELERKVKDSAQKQVRSQLRDLAAKGLRVSFGTSGSSKLNVRLDGPAELIKEAKRRLN